MTDQPAPTKTNTGSIEHVVKAPILEAVGLSKVYRIGKQTVTPVYDISLQVGYGDFAVIFGPSGAGKSTLLNILMGVEPPDVGQVFLKGESFYDYTPEERATIRLKKMGLIPQGQLWMDNLTVLDNIALPLLMQGVKRRQAHAEALTLLESMGLSDHARHHPGELSSGQQQKASLARALITKPWIIFADELTAHLDTKSVEEVTNILVRINREQRITVVMVTHDLAFLKYSKKWFFVRDGKLFDIKDHRSPFHNIKEALAYVEGDQDTVSTLQPLAPDPATPLPVKPTPELKPKDTPAQIAPAAKPITSEDIIHAKTSMPTVTPIPETTPQSNNSDSSQIIPPTPIMLKPTGPTSGTPTPTAPPAGTQAPPPVIVVPVAHPVKPIPAPIPTDTALMDGLVRRTSTTPIPVTPKPAPTRIDTLAPRRQSPGGPR